jgi:hypothetical protein
MQLTKVHFKGMTEAAQKFQRIRNFLEKSNIQWSSIKEFESISAKEVLRNNFHWRGSHEQVK